MARETWKSMVGFTFAALGSAVGLANICIFPFLVGMNGGAAFVFVYLICLVIVGFPVFISEILLGRTTRSSPAGAFRKVGGKRFWPFAGKMTVLTGFIVTSFYSVLAGWVLGYFVEALKGTVTSFGSIEEASQVFDSLVGTASWGLMFHGMFMLICLVIVFGGVRRGIERCSKIMMPVLIFLLLSMVVRGITLPNAWKGISYLFYPDLSEITGTMVLLALGQAFFTLSLGQGTMITYGSYLTEEDNIPKACIQIAIGDTLISLCAAIAVFTTLFSAGLEPAQGVGLIFKTLPIVFTKLPFSWALVTLFFLFVTLAAVTSEISAMEPVIAYLVDEKKWKRHSAVLACGIGGFALGIPCALSFSILKDWYLFGYGFMDFVQVLVQAILLPFGAFCAVFVVGWVWKWRNAERSLTVGSEFFFRSYPWFSLYLRWCIKYSAPILIILVFINKLFRA